MVKMKPLKTLSISILILFQFILAQNSITGKVVSVKDGDIIHVLTGKITYIIRLAGRNAKYFQTRDQAINQGINRVEFVSLKISSK